jgi:hypothetical protein
MPCGRCAKRGCGVLQAAVGAFCASIAAAGSTGRCVIDPSPPRSAWRTWSCLSSTDVTHQADSEAGDSGQPCRARGDRRTCEGGTRHNLGPPHHLLAVPNLDGACGVFADADGAARGGVAALPLQLQQAIVVAHHPVIGDDSRLLEAKHPVQGPRWRAAAMKVVGRPPGRGGSARCAAANTSSRERYSRARRRRSRAAGAS